MTMWLLLLLAAVIAVPLVIEAQRHAMNDKAREKAPGRFADLSQGRTHYQWHGPEDGPVCVCIHGLTTPSFVWEGLAPELTRMGFRTLTYDLYGRGFSDRAGGRQDTAFFLRQLNDLLDHEGVEDDLTLIGYSMGGVIATAFAASQPHGIRRVVLLAPAGMADVGTGRMQKLMRLPVIGTWLMLLLYPGMLRKGLKADAHLPTSVPDITTRQDAELDWRGFVPAVHSSLTNALARTMRPEHETLRREGIPVLAIWGREDSVIPLSAADTLKSWNPEVENWVIDGAGHGLTYTHTTKVAALIDAFVSADD